MANPLDHRQSAMGGPRLHVYAGHDGPVAAISGPVMATMLRSTSLHPVVTPFTPCRQSSYTISIPSFAS